LLLGVLGGGNSLCRVFSAAPARPHLLLDMLFMPRTHAQHVYCVLCLCKCMRHGGGAVGWGLGDRSAQPPTCCFPCLVHMRSTGCVLCLRRCVRHGVVLVGLASWFVLCIQSLLSRPCTRVQHGLCAVPVQTYKAWGMLTTCALT
jgi:hypothetical protein